MMTTHSLSRRVAELVGWKFEVVEEFKHERGITIYYIVSDRDGRYVEWDDWVGGRPRKFADYALDDSYPDYEEGATEALRDLLIEGYRLNLHQVGDMWQASYYPDDYASSARPSTKPVVFGHESNNPAVAICEAFVALKARLAQESETP